MLFTFFFDQRFVNANLPLTASFLLASFEMKPVLKFVVFSAAFISAERLDLADYDDRALQVQVRKSSLNFVARKNKDKMLLSFI